ncbi:polymer-forming cytoskeletal protein [Nesterenkonia natronophila]|uniref:Polymer-forming cytoskeletal protein n=1 Tax=Nesterenkonia natronophila TaxID=2174932 RepID=A0A3A4F7W2_9MICC|nr:polymer-forming cytoskeletal protein [Nesterenkonia natronophila]RJN32580.1 polymer-forming cytoskeletal protein [Nesterenkonia natronophila]
MTTVPGPRLRPLLSIVLGLGFLLAGCGMPAEAGRYSVTVITQQHHVVEGGQVLFGDTVVLGGTVVLAEGAENRGPVTVLAGEARISGEVNGDLTVLGGDAILTETAEVSGDVTATDGALTLDAGAVIGGSTTDQPSPVTALESSRQPLAPAERVLRFVIVMMVMAGFAWLVAHLAPRPLRRTASAATGFPLTSGALGALVLISALPLVVSMVFTLFLIPVAGVVLIGFGLTLAYGLLAVGCTLGARIARHLGCSLSAPWAAALGTAGLVACLQIIGLIPFLGVAVTGIVIVVSIGAVFLTGFGIRGYNPPDDELEQGSPRGVSS